MKIFLISQSSALTGKQIAKELYSKFSQDRKRPTKNEFTSSVKVGYSVSVLIDGPVKGTKTKVRIVGSYYAGKSLVGPITYPLNALVYDSVSGKSYMYVEGRLKSEISKEHFVEAAASLRDFIDGSSSNLDSFLLKLNPEIQL